jgi:hypothetical protein
MNSLKNRLSNMTDKELEYLNKTPITELGQRRSSDDVEDLRQELRQEKQRHKSPKSFLNRRDLTDQAESIKRLHEARDKRSLQLPSLVERKSQDYSQVEEASQNEHLDLISQ